MLLEEAENARLVRMRHMTGETGIPGHFEGLGGLPMQAGLAEALSGSVPHE